MSHFTVMVFGSDPESQLRPFQENNMNTCSQEFLEFEDKEDELRDEYQNKGTGRVIMPDGRKLLPCDDTFRVPGQFGYGTGCHKVPEEFKVEEVPFKESYSSLEQFAEEWHGFEVRDPKTGRFGYWKNPNAKWDWYELGGRWVEYFHLKGQEGLVAQAKKGDIDIEYMKTKARKAAEERYQRVLSAFPGNGIPEIKTWKEFLVDVELGVLTIDDARKSYHSQAPLQMLKTVGIFASLDEYQIPEDEFVQQALDSVIVPHALIKDGKWYERGEMGVVGMYFQREGQELLE